MNLTSRRLTAAALLSVAVASTAISAPAAASAATTPVGAFVTSAFAGYEPAQRVTIAKGESVTFVGHLVDTTYYKNLVGYSLTLYARTSTSLPWVQLRTLVTGSDGKVSQKVTPNYSTDLQWRFAGANGITARNGQIMHLQIGLPQTGLATTGSVIISKGASTTFVGHLSDWQTAADIPDQPLALYVRSNPSGSWTYLKTLTTSSTGRVSQLITPNYTTEVELRFAGSATHAPTTSHPITITVGVPPTGLAITPNYTVSRSLGSSLTLAGRLYDVQTNRNLAGFIVTLYARTSSAKPWVKIETLTTSATGMVYQKVTAHYSTELQWRYAGNSVHTAVNSPVLTLEIT